MKKIKVLLIFITGLIMLPLVVNASSASINISGASTVVVGNRVSLTVRLSSGTPMGSWQMMLNYDSKYLQFTGGGGEAGGMSMAASSAGGIGSKTYTFNFKALKSGNTKVEVQNYIVYAFNDMSEMRVSSSGKSLKIMTQAELEASYSKDNNLKNLAVEGFEITPVFNKDTLEYNVNIPEGTSKINVISTRNDDNSTVSGDGILEVSEGSNSFQIVVKAQNGAEKIYKLNVNVIDENPVNVKIEGVKYKLLKYKSTFTCPATFEEGNLKINEFTVPSCVNNRIKYTLVGLKNEQGNIITAIYKDGKYYLYKEIGGSALSIVPLDYKGKISGYNKTNININNNKVTIYKVNDDSKFGIIYGLNLLTGKKDLYLYDEENKALVLYDNERVTELEQLNIYLMCAASFFGLGLMLSLILIISKNKRKKTKDITKITNKQKEEKRTKKNDDFKVVDNEIEEIGNDSNNEENVYNIFDDNKKKKHKKEKKSY